MVDHAAVLLAARARALAISVCTTGAIALSATATGYARASGSFVADGFAVGMELTASGFASSANNGRKVVTAVSALAIACAGCVAEGSGNGRTLAVLCPAERALENSDFIPTGKPYYEEQYLPGPRELSSFGPNGRITAEPMYLARVNVPSDSGPLAAYRYADALLAQFPAGLVMTLGDGSSLQVRGKPAPFAGQLLQRSPGFAGMLVSIPMRCYSFNSI